VLRQLPQSTIPTPTGSGTTANTIGTSLIGYCNTTPTPQ
jgi:hypothetical protein